MQFYSDCIEKVKINNCDLEQLPSDVSCSESLPSTMSITRQSPRLLTFIGHNPAIKIRLSSIYFIHAGQLAM